MPNIILIPFHIDGGFIAQAACINVFHATLSLNEIIFMSLKILAFTLICRYRYAWLRGRRFIH